MNRLVRAFLLINFILIFCSCTGYKIIGKEVISQKEWQEVYYFSDKNVDYLFRIQLQAFGNTFGGILAIKKLGNQHHRVAVLTDFGNTFFDFEFIGTEIKVHYVMPDFNKKVIVKKLAHYFQLLVYERYPIKTVVKQGTNRVVVSKLEGKRIFLKYNSTQQLINLYEASTVRKKIKIEYFGRPHHLDSLSFQSLILPISFTAIRKE